jgi:two-component system, OmpR family, sensor histidine kinase ChvG
MASDTDTGRSEPRARRRWLFPGSRLARLITVLNLLSLAVLVAGALVVNEQRQALVGARKESLTVQGEFLAELIAQFATVGEPAPALDSYAAAQILQRSFIFENQRARLFDLDGRLVIDSNLVTTEVEQRPLPPIGSKPEPPPSRRLLEQAERELAEEVAQARSGETFAQVRRAASGERVVSVSIPVRRVRAVLGVITLEASDFNDVVAAQRRALLPFILIAIAVSLLSSLLLAQFIARPIDRLATAADRVRLAGARAISLPGLSRRGDEIGDLARSLEAMTRALSERMDAIEAFAADVAHEVRNPLTSIRSAVETLELVRDPAPRARLLNILKQDVQRLDRLVTDISNASRLDAELSRDPPRPVDLDRLLGEIVGFYGDVRRPEEPAVTYEGAGPAFVSGREGPLGQVFRNLIDNAKSFSPAGGRVRVSVACERGEVLARVEDEGPGIPAENLETIFERFYTSRPQGAAFGGNSGLGLSIARQIVEAHGGRIWAENRADAGGGVAGARFQVALPQAGGTEARTR